jgi:non-heme chloroperoxidase
MSSHKNKCPKIHKKFVTVSDGVNLFTRYYGIHGHPVGTVILVHGIDNSSKYWTCMQLFLFNLGYNSISYDARGQGYSDKADNLDYSPTRLIQDAVDVTTAYNITLPIIAGVSLGGDVVLGWAGGFLPNLPPISQLILFDASARPFNLVLPAPIIPNIGLTDPALQAVINIDFAAFTVLSFNDICKKCPSYAKLLNQINIIGNQANPVAIAKILSYGPEVDAVPILANITVPTLIVHGGIDAIFPFDSAIFLKNNIINSQLAGIPNRSHNSVVTDPAGVEHAVANFLGNTCRVCNLHVKIPK